ncbi:hypothetical protein [Cellulomonas fimi]|uniref:Uncharacterized protein n=1 Tax=Cellulomonas fimi TaxID=1708 RepID=A0A7Y0QIV9_CELFI|nr:hypothetical protein [Cellulomonas fimi]NMR21648.1 hypothetical protein [Cellulomonas fimi]
MRTPVPRLEHTPAAPRLEALLAELPRVRTHTGLQQPGAPVLLEVGDPREPGYRYVWSNSDLEALDAELRALAALRQHLVAINLR